MDSTGALPMHGPRQNRGTRLVENSESLRSTIRGTSLQSLIPTIGKICEVPDLQPVVSRGILLWTEARDRGELMHESTLQ